MQTTRIPGVTKKNLLLAFISTLLSMVLFGVVAENEFLKNEQIDAVDLLESFREQEKPPRHFSIDLWHPNEEGHELIATRLLPFVKKTD